MKTVAATEMKNRFGRYLDDSRAGPVAIEKNGRTVAVMLSMEEFERLSALEDEYWAGRAREAEKGGYLGVAESAAFVMKRGLANIRGGHQRFTEEVKSSPRRRR